MPLRVKQADIDRGHRAGVSSIDGEENKRLRQELKELKRVRMTRRDDSGHRIWLIATSQRSSQTSCGPPT